MVKNILVIGLTSDHAGKTNLSQALLSYFSENRKKTGAFKPFSGFNYWYHFDMAHYTLSQGRLYSKDISKLQMYASIDETIEVANPIHRLWNEPASLDGLTTIPPFIMDRFSVFEQGFLNHHLLINQQLFPKIPNLYTQKIKDKKYTIHETNSIQSMNDIIQQYYSQAIETCYQQIVKKVDLLVIESYSDNALLPWRNLDGFDYVFGIKPWEIQRFDPDKYMKALELSKPVSAWETSTKKISDLLKPIKSYRQQPALSKDIMHQLKHIIPSMID